MALREELEKQGQWLFRWRSYLPILFIFIYLPILLSHPSRKISNNWDYFCIFISFIGFIIRIYTKGYTSRGSSGRTTKKQRAKKLNTKGLYSIVRNPLYLGNYFMWLGIILLPQILSLAIIFTALFWLFYERIIFREEVFLRQKFGDQYLHWAKKTPAFIPRLRQYEKPKQSFNLKLVLKREYNGLLALVSSLFIFKYVRQYIMFNKIEIDLFWSGLLGMSFLIWLTIKGLRKTNVI